MPHAMPFLTSLRFRADLGNETMPSAPTLTFRAMALHWLRTAPYTEVATDATEDHHSSEGN